MIITAIEPRRKALSAIYVDGEFFGKLDTEALIENRITVGTELDDEDLRELIFKSEVKRAKNKALWLISYRDHTEGELFSKLTKDFSEEAAASAVARMKELNLTDDEAVARRYAEELHRKHQSPQNITYKLTQKGIQKELAQEIVDELSIDPVEEISALIEKKYLRKLSEENGTKRVVAALQRAGYRYGDIRVALQNFTSDEEDYYE